jgi:hypothetical protein
MGYYSNRDPRDNRKSPGGKSKASKYAGKTTEFQGDIANVPAQYWFKAILAVLADGCCLSFAVTQDQEAVVITVLDKGTPIKAYLRSESEVQAALEKLTATAVKESREAMAEQSAADRHMDKPNPIQFQLPLAHKKG